MARLTIRGARQHNLKDLDLAIPRDRLVVITGPSGSGKSSLAFDTIYAEGQRRYVESLSAYARQFLEQLAKPAVEAIEGLSPAIAIEQRPLAKNPRSTVGTVTEISDYLRLLYARVGTPHCPGCGKRIEAQTAQQIVDRIFDLGDGTRASILAPICRGRRGELKIELERLRREGFVRVRIDGEVVDLGDDIVLDRAKTHDLDVVVDRIVVKDGAQGRVNDSVELALKLGDGVLLVDVQQPDEPQEPFWMSERFACVSCGISLPPIEPRMFSFNGPHGACPSCGGLGVRSRIDPARVVPNEAKTLREGAILAWGRRGSVSLSTETDRAVSTLALDPDVAWRDLPKDDRDQLLYGSSGRPKPDKRAGKRSRRRRKRPADYEGIIVRLERLLEGDGTPLLDEGEEPDELEGEAELGRFIVTVRCDHCGGQRLRPEALAVRLGGRNIAELGTLPLSKVRRALVELSESPESNQLGATERAIMEPLVRAVVGRLGFLIDVGLDYLSLDRSAQTLSGGEGQRIRLATQIGSALVGVLYVLDEPSVGLHAKDNHRLLDALRSLVDMGNSVLVVEHDRDAINAADEVIDMGPGAGLHGGYVVAQGTPEQIAKDPDSVTGPYLSGAKGIELPSQRKRRGRGALQVLGARTNNLKNIDVSIPTGLLVAVTGVSGSGKSSLIIDTLLAAARAALYRATGAVGPCDGVDGLEQIDKVVAIDQAPIGRTPRSNPATYTGLFGALRELYAGLPAARARGYRAGRFSFNVKGGRCEACQGDGVRRVEMHFLPDMFVTCEECGGKRYNRETLEVLYRGMSISDALDLTVDEARQQFEAIGKLRDRLEALARVGLGYVKLGQPATTLSGGEAQRVKLARELAKRATGSTLYMLDEPTTGLHFSDIEMLMVAVGSLRDAGNTVIIIEHNIDVIASCDWVIDLGPAGGERGGHLVAEGTPEQVANIAESATGAFLAERLGARPGKGRRKQGAGKRAKKKAAPKRASGKGNQPAPKKRVAKKRSAKKRSAKKRTASKPG
ncbi:MAG: excinuclease ABC subunit UvrA [Deltaproteobacteria bacterium]|nr:excinuclease ABC subunit UvrA [Deltaproteobacteria bacterium]